MHTTESEPVALVTGAGRGIGRAVAVALARSGYRLVLTARGKPALEAAAQLCTSPRGAEPIVLPADLAHPEHAPDVVERALARTGRLDLLVNNAGCALARPFHESEPEDWDRVMNLNAKAPFFLTRAALPALRRAPNPAVVNIGSVVSIKGYEHQSVYTASKHALAGWTKSLAREVAGDGIRVHLIAPGGVDTDLGRSTRPDIDSSDLIAPEEVARAVVFLLESRGKGVIDVLEIHREGKTPFA